jgi:hypothetical protein
MPVDPGSLAGKVYYLCDTEEVVGGFEGMGMLDEKEGRMRLGLRRKGEKRYRFGEMVGASGTKGVGIFAVDMEVERNERVKL